MINPNYYKWHPKIECKDVICEFPFNLASVIKYVWRVACPDARKHTSIEGQVEDLRKAIQYLEFEIERIQDSKISWLVNGKRFYGTESEQLHAFYDSQKGLGIDTSAAGVVVK